MHSSIRTLEVIWVCLCIVSLHSWMLQRKYLLHTCYLHAYYYIRYTFFVKSQHSKMFVWLLFLGFRTLESKYFSKIYQSKGPKPKNIGRRNFYDCCDLTKKVYLYYIFWKFLQNSFSTYKWILHSTQHIVAVLSFMYYT